MKFDNIIIANTPYSGSTHLKVLEHALTLKKDDGVLVNLSPIRWLQDPLWKYKKTCDRKKYQKSIVDKISDLEIVKAKDANKEFSTALFSDLGIYTFKNEKIKNIDEVIKLNDIDQSILNKVLPYTLENNIGQHYSYDEKDHTKYNIKCVTINGSNRLIPNNHKRIYSDVKEYKQYKSKGGGQFEKNKDKAEGFVSFNTELEAQNFLDSIFTKFYEYLIRLLIKNVAVHLQFFPYMNDYTKPWTDKRLFEFFNLTQEEQDYILECELPLG